jgi:hypothetical protein
MLDNSVALTCDLQSTVCLPTHAGADHSESLRLSGRDCIVTADGSRSALPWIFRAGSRILMPQSSPQLAMNWNWSKVRLLDAEAIGSNSLRLDIALMF